VKRERALDEILRASAEDPKGRGGLELSECFVDGTFVGTRKGRIGGIEQAGPLLAGTELMALADPSGLPIGQATRFF
jgi:hypothetical protein